ncbi:hypothetical protein ABT160_23265 [Streptomyces sp. NPDC001941]|uniref:hypothetical protein n=1 Tax=Streptomyces sp. NPDC001941 TaxID=3154659 RepID=UPI00331785B5
MMTSPTKTRSACALIFGSALAVTLLTGCGGADAKDDSQGVASLDKGGSTATPATSDAAPKGKKVDPQSAEGKQALAKYNADINTCLTRKAKAAGIDTEIATDSHSKGAVQPKGGFGGKVAFMPDGSIEGSPVAKKWWGELVPACRKAVPMPQFEGATDPGQELARARKQYQCLKNGGLEYLHEPTSDNSSVFTQEGTNKYFSGSGLDPHSKSILNKCGIQAGG